MNNAEITATCAALAQLRTAAQIAVMQATLTDEQVMSVNTLYPQWDSSAAYVVGQIVNYNNNLYRCAQAHTAQPNWTPSDSASLWSPISFAEDGTEKWTQPSGAHDAYAKGAIVLHGGKTWASDVDGNVWEPCIYGWTEVEGK